MTDIDAEFLDDRVAELEDKLSELLAEMEATAISWAVEVIRQVDTPTDGEEA